MKKILSYLLVAIMMLSLAACGSEEKKVGNKTENNEASVESSVDAVEILEKAINNAGSINAIEANLTIAGNAESEGEKVEIEATADLVGNNLGKDTMELQIPVKLSMTGQDTIEATLYYKDSFIYADVAALLGQNLKLELDLSEIPGIPAEIGSTSQEEVEGEATDEDLAKIKEALNLTVKETEDKYVLSMDADWKKLIAIFGEAMEPEEKENLEKIDFNTFKIEMTTTADGMIESIELDVEAALNDAQASGTVSIKGKIEFTDSVNISFPDFSGYVDAEMLLNQLMGGQ